MNKISKILSVTRVERNGAQITDIKIDPGAGANMTAEEFTSAGDDTFPLLTDYVVASATQRSGGQAAVGYLDPLNIPKAQPGDKRIYARAAEDGEEIKAGAEVSEVWLKNDGSVLVSNINGSVLLRADGGTLVTTPKSTFDAAADGSIKGANEKGSFDLQAEGDFIVNKVKIDTAGNITSPQSINGKILTGSESVQAAGKELVNHDHPIAWTDPAGSGTSGPNN